MASRIEARRVRLESSKLRQGIFRNHQMQFEKSKDTQLLESALKEVKVGETITYDQLSKAIGRNVREHAYPALRTARQGLVKSGIVFGVEENVGLTRLNDKGIVESTEQDRKAISRRTRKTLEKLSVAKFENLDEETKRKHIAVSAQMGALQMFATKTATKKIESKVGNDSKVLPVGETLKLFGG